MNALKTPFISSLKVKAIYDDNFKGKFGDDVVNAARRVLAQAQNFWKLRDSLTTEVNFKVDPNVDYIPGKWMLKLKNNAIYVKCNKAKGICAKKTK